MKRSAPGGALGDGQSADAVPGVEEGEQGAGRHATGAMLVFALVLVLAIFLSPLAFDLARLLGWPAGG